MNINSSNSVLEPRCTRLTKLLPQLIFKFQSAFVPGRIITDNALLAFGTLHHMKCKSRGHECEVALKMDISKAYDRVNWYFLKHVLLKLGFHTKCADWSNNVFLCSLSLIMWTSTESCWVLVILIKDYGKEALFLHICLFLSLEGLSALITKAELSGDIHGIRVCR